VTLACRGGTLSGDLPQGDTADTAQRFPLPLALSATEPPKDLLILRHQTIAKVTADLENLKFNTAISALMIYFNRLSAEASPSKEDFSVFMRLLHPLAPHITDELWERLGGSGTLMKTAWPRPDAAVISERDIEVPVQVNGKLKARLKVKETTGDKELERLALESAAPYMVGKTVVKVIVVKSRLVSIVVK
jgi:leucyl-tRNA synthetase